MKAFKNWLLTGLILQLAIGPVFFFIMNVTIQKTLADGLIAVSAVTIADYIYIVLVLLGLGKLFKNNKTKKIVGIISSIILIIFGIAIIRRITNGASNMIQMHSTNLVWSFFSVFFLAISNPMAIVFFTSLFTAKAIEYTYKKRELIIFWLATGLATLIFMWLSVVVFSFVKGTIPIVIIQTLNIIVGCVLIGYGGIRLRKTLVSKNKG